MRLDEADVAAYREHGWVRLGRIASPSDVFALRAEERRFRLDRGYGAEHNDSLRVNVQLCHRSAVVRRFCVEGDHVAALRDLLGPDVCLTHQQFVTKLPDTGALRSDIPMHQDAGYGELDPPTDVTIWLPLVDTDEANGGLRVVSGSHRAGTLEHGGADVNPVLREAPAGASELVPLRAGEAVAFGAERANEKPLIGVM